MNLIIFGPPGSGKGTYSSSLQERLWVVWISTGNIFREAAKENTEMGKKLIEIMTGGGLVPDEITVPIVKENIQRVGNKGFIIDGFPRTVRQAEILDTITKIDAVMNLLIPEEILVEKISARRMCSKCDGNYNLADIHRKIDSIEYVLPPILPKKNGICDKCGGKLYRRKDDEPEIIRKRLDVYTIQSKPVIEYYRKKVPFIDIHVNRPFPEIMERILEELKKINAVSEQSNPVLGHRNLGRMHAYGQDNDA